MTSGDGSIGRVDPQWAEELPATNEDGEKQNLGTVWLSSLRKIAPLSPSNEAQRGLLQALLCQGFRIDPLRSQPGHLLSTLLVVRGITNRYKTLHGGAIGSLVEILGRAAIQSLAETSDGSVTDVNITYISGTPVTEEVEFEAKVLHAGRSIAVAAVDVRNRKSAEVAAQGRVTMCFDPTSNL